MINIIRKIAFYGLWKICTLFPLDKKKIIVMNFQGENYGGNSKYIAEAILRKETDCKLFCVLKRKEDFHLLPSQINGVLYYSLKYIYHFATANVWIDTCRNQAFLKRKQQFYLQTWHGTPSKKIEADAINSISEKYYLRAKKDSKNTDLVISDSKFMTNIYHKSFWYDGPILECGYPSYDILYKNTEDIKRKISVYYKLENDCKFVLYAPTFRKNHETTAYNVDWDRQLDNLKKKFGGDFIALIHLHPHMVKSYYDERFSNNVINCTHYPDMQELIAASDILIGDYSSVNYDFSISYKPVFRFCSDLNDYLIDRDTYYDFETYPWAYAQSNDELEEIINNFDEKEYKEKVSEFFNEVGIVYQANSSELVAQFVIEFINSTKSKKKFMEEKQCMFVNP